MTGGRFVAGAHVLHRQVWRGKPWLTMPVVVVADEPWLLALYVPEGTPFGFHEDHPLGPHPWQRYERFFGHGRLLLQRPGEAHAAFAVWEGADRRFAGWYVNFQEPFRRRPFGVDTQDQELDLWLPAGGGLQWKDVELLDERVRSGRFSEAEGAAIRAEGERVAGLVERGEQWWDDGWRDWQPPPGLAVPGLPAGWRDLV